MIKIKKKNQISKDYLVARLATLSNIQKLKIKLLNNSTCYLVNEELIDLQTVSSMKYSPPRSPPFLVVDTHESNKIDNSIQDIPSPLSVTVKLQQNCVTYESLNKSYSN